MPWKRRKSLRGAGVVIWFIVVMLGQNVRAATMNSLPPRCARNACTRPPVRSVRVWPQAAQGHHSRTSLLALPFSATGLHLPRIFILLLFIAVDSGQALVMDWAEKRPYKQHRPGRQYARQTALVVESGLSMITGLALLLASGERLSAVGPLFLRFFPVALCFAIGLSLKMMAVNHFQAGTIKIVGQLRLGLVAVASTIIFSRRYSSMQWLAITSVTVCCVRFVQLKGRGRNRQGKPWKWVGLSQLYGWVCMNVVGGILAEKTYKSSNMPYYIQKVAQDMGHLVTSLVMLFLVVPRFYPSEDILNPSARPDGFFDSWDTRTCFVVASLFVDAWISNLLLKEFSGVTRGVAKAAGVAIVYFASLLYSKDRRANPELTVVAMLVILGSITFAAVS